MSINTDLVSFGTQKFVSQRDLLLSAEQARFSCGSSYTLREQLSLQRCHVKTLVVVRLGKLLCRGAQDFPELLFCFSS